jgi:GT2 family glycosyltransferase
MEPGQTIAVVVTYNRPKELRLVIESLLSQTKKVDRILVVDNASQPPATQTLSFLQDSQQVEIIRNTHNLGGAGGFATGIEAALKQQTYQWIWIMDDDAVPTSNTLQTLFNTSLEQPGTTGALCCSVYENNLPAFTHHRYFHSLFGLESPVTIHDYQKTHCPIDTGSFVGFFLNAHAGQKIGVPNANFFLAYDDTEYSLRLKQAGYQIYLVPGAKINHLKTAKRLRETPFGLKHYYNIRNRLFVYTRFTQLSWIALLYGGLLGLALWLICGGIKQPGSFTLLKQSISDGIRGKLGIKKQ